MAVKHDKLTPLEAGLCEWLRRQVQHKGAKQQWVARQARMSERLLCGILTGARPMTLRSLQRLSLIFDTTPAAVMTDVQNGEYRERETFSGEKRSWAL